MIKHIVMFKLKENYEGKTAYELAQEAKERATGLSEINALKKIETGVNSPSALQDNYEFVLVCDFENIDALNEYQVHPIHKAFGEFIKEIRTGRACIDYEY